MVALQFHEDITPGLPTTYTAHGAAGRNYLIVKDGQGVLYTYASVGHVLHREETCPLWPDPLPDLTAAAQSLENLAYLTTVDKLVAEAAHDARITHREASDLLVGIDAQTDAAREFVTTHPDRVPALISSEEQRASECAAAGNHMQATAHEAYAALLRALTEEN